MEELISRIQAAKTDKEALNRLITDYIPFIKSEAAKSVIYTLEYEDRFSIAMLVFMNCILQFDETKGGFFAFASASIKNRLIDEGRKMERRAKTVSLDTDDEETGKNRPEEKMSVFSYYKEQERLSLSEEIDMLAEELAKFHIDFSSLEEISPKQKRARYLCLSMAFAVTDNPDYRHSLFVHHRIPQADLAKELHVSEKTIEKHRRYVVTLAVILSGNYPAITAFLPDREEVVS